MECRQTWCKRDRGNGDILRLLWRKIELLDDFLIFDHCRTIVFRLFLKTFFIVWVVDEMRTSIRLLSIVLREMVQQLELFGKLLVTADFRAGVGIFVNPEVTSELFFRVENLLTSLNRAWKTRRLLRVALNDMITKVIFPFEGFAATLKRTRKGSL